MAYLHFNHTHTRERSRSRERSPTFSPRQLIRRNSKRQRDTLFDDDDLFDDYPHNTALTKPSRALTIREPNQLEKLNIWSAPTHTHHHRRHHHNHHHHRRDSFDHEHSDHEHEHEHDHFRFRHIHRRSVSRGRSPSPSHSDNTFHIQESDRDREFRLKIKAAVSIPRRTNSFSHHHHHNHHHAHQPSTSTPTYWPGDWFRSRSREKWSQEDWESRERRGHATNSFWADDEPKVERKVTFRKIKRTKTDEWKPLQNLRRFDWKD